MAAHALQGPPHPELGIAMDMSIQLATDSGAICTLSLSFNNDGPFGTTFRYIGDTGTYVASYDDLATGHGEPIDVSGVAVSMNGIELQDREFFAAIAEGREPNASVAQVLDCYRVLDRLERQCSPQLQRIRTVTVPMNSIDDGEPSPANLRVARTESIADDLRDDIVAGVFPVGRTADRGPALRSLLVRSRRGPSGTRPAGVGGARRASAEPWRDGPADLGERGDRDHRGPRRARRVDRGSCGAPRHARQSARSCAR